MKFSSLSNISVQQVPQPPILKLMTCLILLPLLFNKMVHKYKHQHLLPPFINHLGLYLSQGLFLNFLSNLCIPTWLWKIFKFMVFRLLENVFASQKIESQKSISPSKKVYGRIFHLIKAFKPCENFTSLKIEVNFQIHKFYKFHGKISQNFLLTFSTN